MRLYYPLQTIELLKNKMFMKEISQKFLARDWTLLQWEESYCCVQVTWIERAFLFDF